MSREFTLLRKEDYFKDAIEVIKKRGTKAAITDFAIVNGGYVAYNYHVEGNDSLDGRTGWYWTRSDDGDSDASVVDDEGFDNNNYVYRRDYGVRPASPFSSIDKIPTNGVSSSTLHKTEDGIEVVEYGYYPQQAASAKLQEELERAYNGGKKSAAHSFMGIKLIKTGSKYTTDSRKYNDYDVSFKAEEKIEYEHKGKKYVRAQVNSYFSGDETTLSNGEKYKDGDFVWIEVQPITWLVDRKAKVILAEKILGAGIQFTEKGTVYHTEDFNKTNMSNFLNKIFAKEIEQNIEKNKSLGINADRNAEQSENMQPARRKSRLERLNPDQTPPEQRRQMTDTEHIKDWIERGESILLRGPSGIGKTERVRNCGYPVIELKLTDNMFPEKVVGSTNLQTGKELPPDYAVRILREAATDEEKQALEENIQNAYEIGEKIYERSKGSNDRIVLLLDELLNVKPAVQSLVYTLVLNKFVESGQGIKLPENVVIVGTGNAKKYSMNAHDLAEPLQKRFVHIYDMEPKVGEWLTEYAIPSKVHPAVTGYIMSKYNENGKSEDLEDIGYFYEEPEAGDTNLTKSGERGLTNDPRSWTEISTQLYNFEERLKEGRYAGLDVEEIIKTDIGTGLRQEWAEEFLDFYNLPTITPKEVIQGIGEGYTQADLPQTINERFAQMTTLLAADEGQVEECRKFIREHCDPEYLSIYDIYWAGKDEKRQELLGELQIMDVDEHSGKEFGEYADEGIEAYGKIGAAYQKSLQRNPHNREDRDEK